MITNANISSELLETLSTEYPATSVESLQTRLPATLSWIRDTKSQYETEGGITPTHFDQKMDLVKSRGFVDGVLFAKSQLLLPEVFTLDAENVSHIRNETRCCVIASALVLHACKISRAPTSILSSEFVPEEVSAAKNALLIVLRKRHS